MAMTANGLAQPTPAVRAKGQPVWLDMDQKELDDAYDQRVYAANMRQVLARTHTATASWCVSVSAHRSA